MLLRQVCGAVLACITLMGCGQQEKTATSGAKNDAVVRVGGKEMRQSEIDCLKTLQGFYDREDPAVVEFPKNTDAGGDYINNRAYYLPVSGVKFLGYPIVGVINDAWIVQGDVAEIAKVAAASRTPPSELEQAATHSDVKGFTANGLYTDNEDYQPFFATAASGGQYKFEEAIQVYAFPQATIPETGTTVQLSLYSMPDNITLAKCSINDPTHG